MKAAYDPVRRSLIQTNLLSRFKSATIIRAAALIVLVGLLATSFYYPSSASSETAVSRFKAASIGIAGAIEGSAVASDLGIPSIALSNSPSLSALMALQGAETVEIGVAAEPRPTGCTDAGVWCLGETVPVVVTGAPLRAGFRERRIQWVAPDGTVPHMWTVDENVENDSYTLETLGSFAQVGTWTVRTVNNRGGGVVVATFEVGDPANPSVDLALSMSGSSEVTANSNTSYSVTVNNLGPDTATNVVVVNPVPANTTFFSASEVEGFTCVTPAVGGAGEIVCTGATLALSESATFVFTFTANSDVTNGSAVYNIAKTDSSTNEPITSNNYADIYSSSTPGAAGGDCELNCPISINAVANTTNASNERGANVPFDAPVANGECGTVTLSHASGSFFPVGTTTVTATSEENGGSCSFTITVEDQGDDPPTISCPANPAPANADSDCAAGVAVGTATATGNNVTLFAIRSDGRPMYTCDANGNCTRTASDYSFQAGVTTITWFAYAHDSAGPYLTPVSGKDPDDTFEEQHRTGTASCTQTVIVNDVTAPSITPPANQTVSADGACQFALPDYTTDASVSDNCACASSDESEVCDDRQPITITQSPAPGTLVGLGTHPITLTANDGSSNNSGAGNDAQAQFTVTVNDTTKPVFTAMAADSSADADASCQAAVPDYTASSSATDNCPASVTLTQSPAAGTMVTKGANTVTVTATDDAGNYETDEVVFTVNDVTAPVISCPANITQSSDPGMCSAIINPGTATATDNCDTPTVVGTRSDNQPLNAAYPEGTTTITWTAADSSDNSASCTQTITVNDTEAPTISCPANITLEPSCPTGAVGSYTAPDGSDNCPGATTTRTAGPASGSVFPIGSTTVTYTVDDAHGNSTSCSFTVTVLTPQAVIQNLISSVNASSLTGTQKNGLLAKLNAALDGINDGKTNVACNKLSDFVNSVGTLISHGDISAAQGNAWISSANNVRNTIGCTNLPCS